MAHPTHSLSLWKYRHGIVTVLGIAANLVFAIPLLFAPEFILGLFGIPMGQLVWPRFAGGLLIILSCFYVPMVVDIDRFRALAWLQIVPSRLFGTVFFLTAVIGFGAPAGFIAGALVDGGFALALLYCLINIVRIEQQIATGEGAAE